jgi:NADH-quinone oxidoreductase subunit C
VATVTTVWNGALWHERETHEMFGIVFQGHPDLRPLLLEESLGYYPLLRSHPLAEIEESQEKFLREDGKQ